MRALVLTLAVTLGVGMVVPAHAASAKSSTKKSASKTSSNKTSSTKAASTKAAVKTTVKTVAHKTSSKKSSSKVKSVRTVTHSGQSQPTAERYAEIEQALVDRGYLETADGAWGASSVDALKRFQTDQNLKPDGKLSALSLTALGLGPRRGAFVVAPEVLASVQRPSNETPVPADE